MSAVPGQSNHALQYALRLLGRRSYTEAQVREKLEKRSRDTGLVDQVINKLINLRCLNDKSFTENYIRFRSQQSPRSLAYLTSELKRKGIEKDMIIDAWNSSNVTDENLCREAAQRKIKSLSQESDQKKREKLIRFLASRGFSWDTINKVIPGK